MNAMQLWRQKEQIETALLVLKYDLDFNLAKWRGNPGVRAVLWREFLESSQLRELCAEHKRVVRRLQQLGLLRTYEDLGRAA